MKQQKRKTDGMKLSRGEVVFLNINNVFLFLLCLLMVYPIVHVFSIAFSSYEESIRIGFHVWPRQVDLTPLKKVFASQDIWRSYYNTIWRTVVGTVLSTLVTALGGYAISKRYLPMRRFFVGIFLFAMYFSGGVVPTFMLIRSLGLMNNRWSMVLPSLVWGSNMIIMRNFFESIPQDMEESAQLDGANEWIILFRIVMPVSKAVIATIAMWMCVYHWNAYMDNLMYFTDKNQYVLQRIIRSLVVDNSMSGLEAMSDMTVTNPESMKAATILVSTVPILLVYPFAQKYFIRGVMIGAVKG